MKTDTTEAASILQVFPLFEGVRTERLEKLAEHVNIQQLGKHRKVYKMGDASNCIYFLIKGAVKVGCYADDGREVIKAVLHPMAMFGELSLTGERQRHDFAASLSNSTQLLSLSTVHLRPLMQENHEFSMRILNFIGRRLQSAEHRLESLIFKDARERIIDFLKQSARQRGKQIGYETLIKHSLTQQDIANITGTSRQTVTSVMNDLRKANLIYFNRRSILIRDLSKLA
ncbi:MAG TPA: Crp/Fnr family transcriptional regulator [Phaeodactylibacter sp.]|nr:Crp/Fnr family transcriptional regulator [Phaeodactylibacter sp.]